MKYICLNGCSARRTDVSFIYKSGSSTSRASFSSSRTDDRKLQREHPQPTPKRNTTCTCMCSRPMCQSHLHDGIEQTRNDAVGLGRAEIVLLGEGCDDFALQNDVVLADGGTGGEGGGGGGGTHGATWSRRAGTGGRGGGGAGSGKAEHGFGSMQYQSMM